MTTKTKLAGAFWDAGVAVLLVLVAGAFWRFRIIAPGTELGNVGRDLFTEIYPSWHLTARWLREAHLPLWNPYQYAGHPLAATTVCAVFYPLNFLRLFLPTEVAIEYTMVLHLALAGLLMFAYGRVLRLSTVGALAAAITFMLSGFLTFEAMWFSPANAAAAWLPLAFIAVEKQFERPRFRWVVALAIATAMPILSGWLQTWLYSAYAIAGYAAVRSISSAMRRRYPTALFAGGSVAVGFLLGLCLAAVQLMPSFELQQLGPREAGGLSLAQVLPFGPLAPSRLWREMTDSAAGHPRPGYLGMLTLVMMPLSLAASHARRPVRYLWLMGLLSIGVALSLNTPLFDLYSLLPGALWFREPRRILILYAFAGAALSGIGVDVVARIADERLPRSQVLVLSAMFAGALCLFVAGASDGDRTLLIFGTVLASVAAVARVVAIRNLLLMACVGMIGGDLFTAHRNTALHPYHYVGVFDGERALFDFIREHQGLDRTYLDSRFGGPVSVMPKQGSLREVYVVTDYDPLTLRRNARFLTALQEWPQDVTRPFAGFINLHPSEANIRMLELMSVRYIVVHSLARPLREVLAALKWAAVFGPVQVGGHASGQYMVYENPKVLPRAYVAHHALFAPSEDQALRVIRNLSFDPTRSVVLEEAERSVIGARRSMVRITPADVVSYEPTRVVVATRASKSGYLVLTDTFYPGWKARVDGIDAPIFRANFLFRAVMLEPGEHIVEFQYDPLSFKLGAGITLLTLAGFAGCGLVQCHPVHLRGKLPKIRLRRKSSA